MNGYFGPASNAELEHSESGVCINLVPAQLGPDPVPDSLEEFALLGAVASPQDLTDLDGEPTSPRTDYRGVSRLWLRQNLAETLTVAHSDAITADLRATFVCEAIYMIAELLRQAHGDVDVAGAGDDLVSPTELFDDLDDGACLDVPTSETTAVEDDPREYLEGPVTPSDPDAIPLGESTAQGVTTDGPIDTVEKDGHELPELPL